VQSKSREERRAQADISNAGLRAWLPELCVMKRRHGRPVSLTEPLFPGYLFVDMDPASPQEWQAVRWARGVRDVVRDGTGPLPVPASAMAVLLGRFKEGVVDEPSPLIPGARVRVTTGPMACLEGLVLASPTPQHRVQVLMELLHRELTVELDEFDLERIS
jgi:transcriptional antiterminator RfaH